jgi:hypothetical protein
MKCPVSLFVRTAFLTAALLAAARPGQAGGPRIVNTNGQPFVWPLGRTINYTPDAGGFGRFSSAQAAQWLAEGFKAWTDVDGMAPLTIQATSPFSTNITGDNIFDVLDTLPDDVNLIIFDDDGSVLDSLFGFGASELYAGLGGSRALDTRTSTITQAWVFLNGYGSEQESADWWRAAIEHELGHFLGLTHSQINPQITFDGDPTNDALAPRMSYNDGPNSRPSLHADDRAWITALYPKPGATPTTGTIHGRVLLPDGKTGLQGIQVAAYRDGDEEVTAVSCVSGYRYKDPTGFGSRDPGLQGFYELPGLPPGNYRLAIEQLDDGTKVAPRHQFLPGGRRLYREGGPVAVQRQEATLVAVAAGQTVEGKDFVLEGPARSLREVKEVEPNGSLEMAQTLSLPAAVSGRASNRDFKFWTLPIPGRRRDTVEDWFRVVVTEPTLLSATLTATTATADLNLFLVSDPYGDGLPRVWDLSADAGTPPETFQARVPPGVYFVGVSSSDVSGSPDSDYRLTVIDTPAPDLAASTLPKPRITTAVVSNLTPTGFRVSWQTDQDANAVLHVGAPLRELGAQGMARDHALDVTGLSAGTYYDLAIFSRNADAQIDELPGFLVNTALNASGHAPYLSAGLWSAVPRDGDDTHREFLVIAHISNFGDGPATDVKLDRMALPAGWSYVGAPRLPLDLGQIGSGAVTVVEAWVTRVSDTASPLDLVMRGTYGAIDGSTLYGFGR